MKELQQWLQGKCCLHCNTSSHSTLLYNSKTFIYPFMVPHEDYVLGPYVVEVEFPSHEDVRKQTISENQLLLDTVAKHLGLYHK